MLVSSPFEFILKEIVGRDRPDLDRLIRGTGVTHPSGHVLAAVTLWGLLPPIVSLLTNRRWTWWTSVAVSAVLITGIAASRAYVGVHWFSVVIQSLLLGWLHLTVIETLYLWHHRDRRCNQWVSARVLHQKVATRDLAQSMAWHLQSCESERVRWRCRRFQVFQARCVRRPTGRPRR